MADLEKLVDDLGSLTLLEASELTKMLEEKWGVSAAAPVAMGMMPMGGAAAAEEANKAGVECKTVHIKDSDPFDGILAASNESGCDLIVMSTHGRRGIDRLLLGSVSNKVLTYSKIPVLVVR